MTTKDLEILMKSVEDYGSLCEDYAEKNNRENYLRMEDKLGTIRYSASCKDVEELDNFMDLVDDYGVACEDAWVSDSDGDYDKAKRALEVVRQFLLTYLD